MFQNNAHKNRSLFSATRRRALMLAAAAPLLGVPMLASAEQPTTLLNVSYDVARELYKQINPAFVAAYKAKTGQTINPNARPLVIPVRALYAEAS